MRKLAQIVNPVLPTEIGGPGASIDQGSTVVGRFISSILGMLFILGFFLFIVTLSNGILGWITSGGDKAKLESARDGIIHSIVGVTILAASWAIITLLGNWIGIDFQRIPIPSVTGN